MQAGRVGCEPGGVAGRVVWPAGSGGGPGRVAGRVGGGPGGKIGQVVGGGWIFRVKIVLE